MAMALAKLIDLSRESVNISMKKIIVGIASLVYLVIAMSKMVFFVFGIGTRLGSNSLSLVIKGMAL